jgi:RimJ/RimL family protein N-acetyltransferase
VRGSPGHGVTVPPIIETRRLRLRPRTLGDLDDCFRMDREPGTLDWIAWPEAAGGWKDEAGHRAFIRARTVARYPPGQGYWVVVDKARPDLFLGWVLLIPEDAVGPEVEIGWRFVTAARGRGYATEGAQAVLAHGLGTLALPRIIADIRRENTASWRVAEKIGMRATGPTPGAAKLVRYEASPDRR